MDNDTCGAEYKNISGQKFGKLTAIKKADKDKNGRIMWLCKCDCGNLVNVAITDLRAGRRKSCGCLQKERYNIIGQRYGKLTVIRRESSGSFEEWIKELKEDRQNEKSN